MNGIIHGKVSPHSESSFTIRSLECYSNSHGLDMIIGPIKNYEGDRNFFDRLIYPIVFVQEFKCISEKSIHEYLTDLDTFPHEHLKDRIEWLISHGIKFRSNYTYEQQNGETFGLTYHLYMGFTKLENSKLYRDRWDIK